MTGEPETFQTEGFLRDLGERCQAEDESEALQKKGE